MSQRPKIQTDTISETQWQLDAVVNLSNSLFEKHGEYCGWPSSNGANVMQAAVIQAVANLLAHNYQRASEKEKAALQGGLKPNNSLSENV
jgi:hypothetical protein